MNFHLLNHPDISREKREGHIEVTNPATGSALAYVRKVTQDELREKIHLSSIAQREWASILALDRANIILKWYGLMLEHREDLSRILTLEMGKPINEARGEITYAANFLRWFAEECRRIDGDILQSVQKDQKLLVLKQPIGVCGAITPWNFPSAMITRKVAPALSCGCSMIVKPASQTPLSAYALLTLAREAGVPDHVLDVVSGDAELISDTLCQSDIVRKITFTGSTETGRKLMANSSNTIKKLSLELGGNAPFIVFNDADIDRATDGIIASKFRNSGQTCVCANRIYVHEDIYDELSLKLREKVQRLKVGNGMDEATTQGPLIDMKAVDKVQEHIRDALSKGATLLSGGRGLGSSFFEPTILTNVTRDMAVSREETFGPLAPLFRFSTIQEAIELANDTQYGLAAYVYTRDLKNIWEIGEKLEYGIIGMNTGIISTEAAPFGGVKQSGLGREGSRYGIEDYLEIKYIALNIGS